MNTPIASSDRLAYNIKEAAHALSLGRSTIYKLINTGELPSATIGTRRLIFSEDLEAFIQRHRGSDSHGEVA